MFHFVYHYMKNRPHVVYTRHQQMEWMVTWLQWVFNFIYVIEVNGVSTVELKSNHKPAWVVAVTGWVERWVFRMPDLLVTPSAHIKDALCQAYGLKEDRFLVVTNGLKNYYCRMDHKRERYEFLKEIPSYVQKSDEI